MYSTVYDFNIHTKKPYRKFSYGNVFKRNYERRFSGIRKIVRPIRQLQKYKVIPELYRCKSVQWCTTTTTTSFICMSIL